MAPTKRSDAYDVGVKVKSSFIASTEIGNIRRPTHHHRDEITTMRAAPLPQLHPPLYQNYRPVSSSDGGMRIYAPVSYAVVRQAQIVPLVHVEALRIAAWFPICWQIKQQQPILVALRTLRDDGSCQPPGSLTVPASLPLALQAYPFVVGLPDGVGGHMLDDNIPDRPSDVGAPVTTVAGKPSRGTDLKMRAAAAFNAALPLTETITEHLAEYYLLEPWKLEFDVAGATVAVPDLFIVRQKDVNAGQLMRFLRTFGSAGAALLGAHRISLFRAGALLQAARDAQSGTNAS